jgi:dTMP kinase
MFITFEGGEGGGKSTQIKTLAARLTEAGHQVLTTREPGGTPVGDQIRAVLLGVGNQVAPLAELLLYSASRAQLVSQVILPHLAGGGIVLCDRYADSTYAYQGYGRGLDLAMLRQLTQIATGGLQPHLTLWLDLPPEVGLARRASSNQALDRLDNEALSFHQRVRAGYAQLATESARWVRIDADQAPDAVADIVWAVVAVALSSPNNRAGQTS